MKATATVIVDNESDTDLIDPESIIRKFYNPASSAYRILVAHGRQVALKATEVALRVPHLNPDIDFIQEAALLHDIGIYLTRAPEIGCEGTYPYICHGYLGHRTLKKEGLPAHALVCERHVGAGITPEDIKHHGLPLPLRSMVPVTVEEQIICYADKFFSKSNGEKAEEKSPARILKELEPYGRDKVLQFERWLDLFKEHETVRSREN